jgi:pSer/pThr/pTyr-binding forkhead associated (FHA) protein
MKEEVLQLAYKIDSLARAARVQDLALMIGQPEAERVQRVAAVIQKLESGTYLIGSGPYTQGVYSIMADEVVLGRLATALEQPLDKPIDIFCQDVVCLTPREVSRYHAMIQRVGDIYKTYYLTDLGSTCGTFLNGKRLNPDKANELPGTELSHGDVISLGSCQVNTYVFITL